MRIITAMKVTPTPRRRQRAAWLITRSQLPGPRWASCSSFVGIVDRELDVREGAHVLVVDHRDRVAVRGDGELDRLAPEHVEHRLEVRVHAVLARPEVDRADGQAVEHGADLIEAEAVHPRRIAVAEAAGQVAFIRKAEAEREAALGRDGGRDCGCGRHGLECGTRAIGERNFSGPRCGEGSAGPAT